MSTKTVCQQEIGGNNVPIPSTENAPKEDLDHAKQVRKYTKSELVRDLAERKYGENGMGITIQDIINEFRIGKNAAQRQIKHLLAQNVLITAQDIERDGIIIPGVKRERPQRYYPSTCRTKMIERVSNRNVLNYTTVDMLPETGLQKARTFREVLACLALCLLYIHKLQIWTSVPKENYELINWEYKEATKAKAVTDRIGTHTVEFHLHPNGSVMIYVSCSDRPFRLHDEQDVSNILVFLGRVEDRLRYHLSDARDSVVPPVRRWIMKGCDVGKDVEIDSVAQITLPDIQIPLFEKALRGYVKPIEGFIFYRVEYALTPNKPVKEALDSLRRETKIDSSCFSLSR